MAWVVAPDAGVVARRAAATPPLLATTRPGRWVSAPPRLPKAARRALAPLAAAPRRRYGRDAGATVPTSMSASPSSPPTPGAGGTAAATVSDPLLEDEGGLGPSTGSRFAPRYWGRGLLGDVRRRAPLYASDWVDGFQLKALPATAFLYFACLAPVVAFGGLTSVLTHGTMGVVEFLVSASGCGVAYAALSGQPLVIIGPTGLTLAFTSALYGFCVRAGIPFLATYAWVGLWTAAILAFLALINASDLIKYCTRFTDEVFNSLIACNFVFEASRSLAGNFSLAGVDKTRPFFSLALALGTFTMARTLSGLRSGKYLRKRVRTLLADFGPCLSIFVMSALAAVVPAIRTACLETLDIPAKMTLAGGRAWLVPLAGVPMAVKVGAVLPALLLTMLFFLDQNISSLNHVRALATTEVVGGSVPAPTLAAAAATSEATPSDAPTPAPAPTEVTPERIQIKSVVESRMTGFAIHALIGASLFFLPLLRRIPLAVICGLFLFLGRNMMTGNQFLQRVKLLFLDPDMAPPSSPIKKVSPREVHGFTALQLVCLAALWALKVNPKTSLFFPSVIASLLAIRSLLARRLFSERALDVLDGELGVDEDDAPAPPPVPSSA
ncbi:hypothetical protein I4F81_012522 [Pyropia yezoensis]|uniref:Uncharacterized protein n=1 Tax=Pyropia yezoensis TaxID=2788 RepID=A0ACC3CIQ6_PYRYE|nr:hypothetical protein I4F81_012522 [Neopyropia yezoensis]